MRPTPSPDGQGLVGVANDVDDWNALGLVYRQPLRYRGYFRSSIVNDSTITSGPAILMLAPSTRVPSNCM